MKAFTAVVLALAILGVANAQNCPISPEKQDLDFSAVAKACECALQQGAALMEGNYLAVHAATLRLCLDSATNCLTYFKLCNFGDTGSDKASVCSACTCALVDVYR